MTINSELEKKIINLVELFNNKSFDEVIEKANLLYSNYKSLPILPNLIGASYAGKNNHNEAIIFFKEALIIDSTNTEILNNLGKSYVVNDDYNKAFEVFKNSLDLDSNNYETYFNLGILYFNKNNFNLALENYFLAIKLNNKFDKLYYNTGIVLSKIGRNKEAINYFLKTLKINPNHLKALNNLGLQFINENKYDLAKIYLNRAVSINPAYAKAFNNLGALYLQKKDYQYALHNFIRAFNIDNKLIISGIQKHFLKRVFCDWSEKEELLSILSHTINSDQHVSPWFCLSMEDNAKNHFIRAKKFSSKFKLLNKNINNYSNKKIRIGYYAADFHEHAGMINMEGIFKHHNKNEFEIFAFYYGDIKKDKTHKRIKNYFDNFFYVNDLEDEEILKLSIQNKIDIAIYRAGLTINARSSIFAQKVAPIQVNFLGYPGTTGQEGIDYIIGDRFVIPKNHVQYFSEKIIFLTDCYYPRDNNRKINEIKIKRKDFNIPENSFVFCSFNNSYKITSEEFEIWINLLNQVPNARLLLLASNEILKKNILNEANKKKINTTKIIFLEKTDLPTHLSRHTLADLFLDSFNCNAHTSAVDSLWAGLPILTKVGNSFASRICASLLKYFELNSLITYTKDEYFKKAIELATNPEKYKEIKNQVIMAKVSEKYFDTKKYTYNLEKAYKKIHHNRITDNKFENVFINEDE